MPASDARRPSRPGKSTPQSAAAAPANEALQAANERQTANMARLLDGLLDVSRVTQGKIALRKQVVELAVAIGSAMDATRPLIAAHGHRLVVSRAQQGGAAQSDREGHGARGRGQETRAQRRGECERSGALTTHSSARR